MIEIVPPGARLWPALTGTAMTFPLTLATTTSVSAGTLLRGLILVRPE